MDIRLLAAIIGVIGTLLGVWIGSRISRKTARETIAATHKNAIELIRINNKKLAGIKLRDAFAPELARLQTQGTFLLPESSDMLERTFAKHQAAVNEFRFFLTDNELLSFNKVWDQYYKDPTGGDKPYFSQYMALSKEEIQSAIDRIKAILEFTKDK